MLSYGMVTRKQQAKTPNRSTIKKSLSGFSVSFYPYANGTCGTYFCYAGNPVRNTYKTYQQAFAEVKKELEKLAQNPDESKSLYPLKHPSRYYHEMELLLDEKCEGATLRDAVNFYVINHQRAKLVPMSVEECATARIEHAKNSGCTSMQVKTLQKHFKRFCSKFKERNIHDLTTLELNTYLSSQKDPRTSFPWSAKTRNSNRASLISLANYSQGILRSLPETPVKTEFHKTTIARMGNPEPVEIYRPDELRSLLEAAIEHDITMIPAIVLGALQGLRPFEIHAETLNRPKLNWDSIDWNHMQIDFQHQKIRDKATRRIPLHKNAAAWLQPFRKFEGVIWNYRQAYNKKLISLRKKAEIRSVRNGFRKSYASYRLITCNQDYHLVAAEMGNSPDELIHSYKRVRNHEEAEEWFSLMPSPDYSRKIEIAILNRGQETVLCKSL